MGNITSQGTTIGIGDGASPEVYTSIPQVTSIGGPDGSASEINVTNLSSTAQEFILGLKDEGSISLDLVFDERDTTHSLLRTKLIAACPPTSVLRMQAVHRHSTTSRLLSRV